VRELTYPK